MKTRTIIQKLPLFLVAFIVINFWLLFQRKHENYEVSSFHANNGEKDTMEKIHIETSDNGLKKIFWHLNGLDGRDPRVIRSIKDEILIPPSTTEYNFNAKKPVLDGQFHQVPKVEQFLGLNKKYPKSGFFIEVTLHSSISVNL